MSHVQYYDFLVYLWGGDLIQIKIHSWEARRQKSSENRAKSADAENRNKNFMTQKNAKIIEKETAIIPLVVNH